MRSGLEKILLIIRAISIFLLFNNTILGEEIPLIGKYGENLKPFPNATGSTSDPNARNVSVDGKGLLYCVWHDARFGADIAEAKEIYLRCSAGKKWFREVRITNDKVQSTCPSVTSSGEYTYLVFDNNAFSRKKEGIYRGDVIFIKLKDRNEISKPKIISHTNSAGNPNIFVDCNQGVHFVWDDFKNGRWNVYYRYMNFDGKLEKPELISLDSDFFKSGNKMKGNNVRPSVTVDKKGNVHIIWLNQPKNDNASGYRAICHKVKSNSQWGNVKVIDQDNEFLAFPSSCIDIDDKVHVSYGKGLDTKLYYSCYDGEKWGKPQLVYDYAGRIATNSSIISDSKLNVHIVWDEAKNRNDFDIFYTQRASGKFSKVCRITKDDKYSGCPTITADQQDNIHILWHDNHDGKFKIYYFMIKND